MHVRYLVPLDGSPLADRIIGQIERLLVREDAEVALLHVVDGARLDTFAMAVETVELAARQHLDRVAKDLRDRGASVVTHVVRGDPAATISEQAERLDADMVVMSTHGRTGLTRLVRGSVAERVLRTCRRPLFMANPEALGRTGTEARFSRILVPLDTSPIAEAILPVVETFARRYESEVLLLRVEWELPLMGDPHLAMPLPLQPLEEVVASLERPRARLAKAGLRVRALASYGPPSAEILDCAEREHADLVAMSTHGRGGPSRWLNGSVAEHVLRHCRRPLLLRRVPAAGGGAPA